MKRIIALTAAALIILSVFAGCSKKEDNKTEKKDVKESVSTVMPTKLDTMEYTLYQNIFFNDKASDYNGQAVEKEGTFATLYDAYNNKTRYYVWGYNDNTKCCDWQWELKIDDTSNLPVNGSLIKAKGTYETNDEALDGLWIINPEITVETKYKGNDCDIDMLAMSNTLERVQIINVTDFPDYFKDKTIGFYGRMKDDITIEDPYYDNSWTVPVEGDYEVPAYGTIVILNGQVKDGSIKDVKISANTQY